MAVSDMTPEMEMKPWIFIRRGRCPQRPGPGEGVGRGSAGRGRKKLGDEGIVLVVVVGGGGVSIL